MSPEGLQIDQRAMIDFCRRLVRKPSLSSDEGAVAALVAQEMRVIGFREVSTDALGNVIGRMGSGSGPHLLYDAHLDTVDVGDRSNWRRDPFGGEIQDGVLYGRGASDMKGAIASMVYAGKALLDSGAALQGDLAVVCVVQEEPCEGLGIRHVVEAEGLRPDWVILGEATNLQVSRGQRGRVELDITVRGRACHASTPQVGINAIYETARLIVGIELLAPQLNDDSFLGKGSIAVTHISSLSGSRNALPDTCTLCVDRRLTGGETEARALAEIRHILTRERVQADVDVAVYRGTTYTGQAMEARQVFPHWVIGMDVPLAHNLVETVEDVLGYVPRLGTYAFSTDGVYTAGVAGIPTIGFGPGEERYAHTVDDQVRLDDLTSAAQVYAELARRMLG